MPSGCYTAQYEKGRLYGELTDRVLIVDVLTAAAMQ
jgi:hypothetical protein